MANSNVDITNKIFAYVKHGKDINQPIKDVYKNSLIFIGDESQLYVPAIDTYVGIGETRFNDVLNNTIWERGEGEVSAQVRFTGSRALGSYSVAEGKETISMAFGSHAEGYKTITGGEYVSNTSDTTEGINVPGSFAHAEGRATIACGDIGAHAEGNKTLASGRASHTEGNKTVASGVYAHAEGAGVHAAGSTSHAEGQHTYSIGSFSHAENIITYAQGMGSHSEGVFTYAIGDYSHSQGDVAFAIGYTSNAAGLKIVAYGMASSSFGNGGCPIIISGEANSLDYTFKLSEGPIFTAYEHLNQNVFKELFLSNTQIYINGDYEHTHKKITNVTNIIKSGGSLTGTITLEETLSDTAINNISYEISSHIAFGRASTITGVTNITYGEASHGEGNSNFAYGQSSHVEGQQTKAIGDNAHAEGNNTIANGNDSHAEGHLTKAQSPYSHAEGINTTASDLQAHAEGNNTTASGQSAHAEGFNSEASGNNSHAEGESHASARSAHSEGTATASGQNAHAEGTASHASKESSHAEGESTTASAIRSHAEGYQSKASGQASHAEGNNSNATKDNSHSEGQNTYANGANSHAEGVGTYAQASQSHAEGNQTVAAANRSHAEGYRTYAAGNPSHAEGSNTYAIGMGSHSEGWLTYAYGNDSHAEGALSYAIGDKSHVEGEWTYTYNSYEHAQGLYNLSHTKEDEEFGYCYNTIHTIGIGTGNDDRKNAFTVMQNGDMYVYNIGNYDGTNPEEAETFQDRFNRTNIWERSTGEYSGRVIGSESIAEGAHAIGEGFNTQAIGYASHAEGENTYAYGNASHTEGQNTYALNMSAHAEGENTYAGGIASHAEGRHTYTFGNGTHAEGEYTYSLGLGSHAEGEYTYSYHYASHAEGFATEAIGWGSHAEGGMPEDMSLESVEGAHTTAFGISSHAEGLYTMAYGNYSHAEGWGSYTIGNYSHAEGRYTYAANNASHAEGRYTYAYGDSSHAEGAGTYTLGVASHTEGVGTHTLGGASHAEGENTYTYNASEHAQGQFNKAHKASNNFGDSYNTIHTIGIGTSDEDRRNAVTVMQNGDMYLYGVADYDGTNPEEATSLQQYFEETEYVISQALNDLHDNINSHELNIPQLPEQGDERFAYLLTGVSTEDGVSLSHTISYQVTGIPTKKYIDELIEANDALRYCGTVTVSAEENGAFTLTHNPSAAPGHGTVTPDTTRGAVYKVTNIGFFGTQRVSPGDMIISYTDTTTASSFEGWDVINENIDLRQLKRSAVNGKAVITNVELTADGTFSYTYSNLAVSNSGTLSMAGFGIAQGGPDAGHVNISGFSSFDNVLDVDDAGGEPAQVISRGVKVLTNVSLSQTNLTTKLTYSYSYIYADTSHHRTRTGFNNGDIALGLEGVNVITGAYLTYKGTFAYSYSRIYVADAEHANEADTLTVIDAVELNSYTHSVGNIYIDHTTNHVTYSYINLSGNTGSYISDIIPAQNDRLHKVITGINQRGDGKVSYTYSYIETESIWERGQGEFSAQLKGTSSSATGKYSVAEGNNTKAVGNYSHAEGDTTKADGIASHAEGAGTIAYGDYSHAEGVCTYASGRRSHSEGLFTYAVGLSSHAEGEYTYALDLGAHTEGQYTYAYNFVSHAEGFATEAIGWGSHAEGGMPEDMSLESVEGAHTTAFGISSHAEGISTMAYGNYSHAEGKYSYSVGNYSHAEGRSTYTYNDAEHAEGSFNKSTPGVTLHSIGIGTDGDNRKNAFEITNTGAAYLFGVGNYNGDNINSAKSLQQYFQDTEYVISSAINDLNDRVNTNEDVMYNSLFSKFEIVNNTISAKIGNVEKSVSVTYTPYSYALSSYTYFWGQPFNGTTNVEGNMINIGYAYTSGNIVITKAAYHKEFNGIVVETNSGRDICFGVGVGGNNRGIYDIDQEGWMIYNSTDANNVAYTFLPNYNIRIGATDAPRVKLDVKGDIAAKALYLGNRVDSNIGSVDPGTMSFYLGNGSYTLTFTSNGTPPGSTACLRPGWDNQNVEFALGQEARPWKIAYISYLYSTITNDYPIRVSSNKMNPNLNADLLDGKHLNQVFDSFVFDTTNKKLKATVGGVEKEVTISGADTLNTPRNFRVSDNTAAHQGAQVLFDGSADVELKLPSYITVNIEGSASTSYEVKTVRNASNATYYLTFVDSDNNVALSGTSPSEKLYTTPNVSINPNTGAVTGTGLGTFNRIKITNESAVKHIEFSRGGVNYITAPASGSIAFATNGKAATAAGTDVIIGDALLAPGNSSVNLGNNDKRWNSLFTNTANLSGQLTSTVAGGHTNHANPDNPVAPSVAGNSPFVITSSKKNDNLNSDLLDDYHANELLEKFDVTLDGDKLNIIIKVGGKEITRSIDIWGDLSNTGVLNAPRVPVTVNGTLNQQS